MKAIKIILTVTLVKAVTAFTGFCILLNALMKKMHIF